MAKKKKSRRASASPMARLDKLQDLALQYQVAAAQEKDAHEEKATISGELLEVMRSLDAKKVETGTIRVSTVETIREKLDEMKLLKAGVSAKTIARCKTKGKPSHSVRVSELKTPRELALIVNQREVA